MNKVKIVVAGVGNCCSALLQSTIFHSKESTGLLHYDIGGFKPSDIQIVGAIDIDSRKVGYDLSQAIFAEPNVAEKVCEVPTTGINVVKGPVLDGADGVLNQLIKVDSSPSINVKHYLEDVAGEMIVCLLPTGCSKAVEFYAKSAIESGYAFVNCTPSRIASDKKWELSFAENSLPLAGDDLMSQIGGTVFHMGLLDFLAKRGVKVQKTYQLDIGGSMEAYSVLEDFRREEKRAVKSEAIKQFLPEDSEVATGTSDFVGFMKDRRTSYFYIEGKNCLNSDLIVDIFFRTIDSSNGAGILLDVVRAIKVALKRNVGGQLTSVSAYGFKNPPVPTPISESQRWFDEFISGSRER